MVNSTIVKLCGLMDFHKKLFIGILCLIGICQLLSSCNADLQNSNTDLQNSSADPPKYKITIVVMQAGDPKYQLQFKSDSAVQNLNVTVKLNNNDSLTHTSHIATLAADTTKCLYHNFNNGTLPDSFPVTLTFADENSDTFELESSPPNGPTFTDNGDGVFSAMVMKSSVMSCSLE